MEPEVWILRDRHSSTRQDLAHGALGLEYHKLLLEIEGSTPQIRNRFLVTTKELKTVILGMTPGVVGGDVIWNPEAGNSFRSLTQSISSRVHFHLTIVHCTL